MSSRSLAAVALLVLTGGGGAAVALGAGGPAGSSSGSSASKAAARTAAAPNTSIPGELMSGLAQDPAGGFRTTTVDYATPGRVSAALIRVPRIGGKAISTPIIRRPAGAARVSYALTAVSQVAAVAAASRRSGGAASRATEIVTTVSPDGHRISEQRVPGLARGASPFVLAVGPTGAVALASTEGARGATVMFSFRPAGAGRFNAPVPLPGASVPSSDGTENSDLIGSALSLAMAPDGGAAIIDGPATALRRVTPAGAVGDAHQLDPRYASVTIAGFRDDGTLVAASTRDVESKTKTIDDQYYSSQITVAEWPPGGPAPTVRALPLQPGSVYRGDNFTLGLGPAGRTTLVLADGDDHLAILAGTGTAIELIGRVRAPRAYDARAFSTADGSTRLLWAPDVGGVKAGDTALVTATAPPGSPFGTPRTIRTASQGSMQIQAALPLPDGRVAIAYDWSAGEENLLIAQP